MKFTFFSNIKVLIFLINNSLLMKTFRLMYVCVALVLAFTNFGKINAQTDYQGTPFYGEPLTIPGIVEAEDFDFGGEGIAYHDTDETNSGPSGYRPDAPGVDMQPNTFEGEPIINIGWTTSAEWLNYTLNVTEDYVYTITGVVATGGADQTFYVDIDFERVAAVPVHTANHQTFVKFKSERFSLTAGIHILTISSTGSTNLDKFIFEKAYKGDAFNGPHTVPCLIQAEDFDTGGEGESFHAGNPGGGNTYRPSETVNIVAGPAGDYHLVGGVGDWYKYTIQVPKGSTNNDFLLRFYGEKTSADHLIVEINGEIVEGITDNIEFPSSYDEPVEAFMPVTLLEGENIITVKFDGGNLDKIEIVKAPYYYEGTPYHGTPFVINKTTSTKIQAEDFDLGGMGIAFHRSQFGGTLNGYGDSDHDVYRKDQDPDPANTNNAVGWIDVTSAAPDDKDNANVNGQGERESINQNGWHIRDTRPNGNDYLNYSIHVEDAGNYNVILRGGKQGTDNANNYIWVDGELIGIFGPFTNTGNWDVYTDYTIEKVFLPTGDHVLGIGQGDINLDYFVIKKGYDGSAYNGPHVLPCTIEAEDFDEGGEGVAYHDKEAGHEGGGTILYRPGVDVEIEAGPTGGYHVGWTNADEWLNYSFEVPEATSYDYVFSFYWANNRSGDYFNILIDGQAIEETQISIPNTGSFDVYEEMELSSALTLDKGKHILTIQVNHGNLDKIVIQGSIVYSGYPFFDEPFTVSFDGETVIEAEDFDFGGEGVSYHDNGGTDGDQTGVYRTDGAGVQMQNHTDSETGEEGINIGWSNQGEWVAYSIQVEDSGDYDFIISLATDNSNRKNHLQVDDKSYPEVTLKTASWTNYKDHLLAEKVPLTAGIHVVYIYYYGNFDKFKIKRNTTAIHLPNAPSGYVYADKEGFLNVKGFSSTASVVIYNILGQKIADYKTISGHEQTWLSAKGIYVVKVLDKGVSSTYKVIVK
jgi:hypothetical protein